VSDEDIPASGSRWEPADGASPAFSAPVPGTSAQPPVSPPEPGAAHGAVPTDEVRPARLPRRLRGRSAVAAAGVGLVLAGGVGGFAIGHAVAGNIVSGGDRTVTDADQNGIPDGGTVGRPNLDPDGDHQGPGGRFPGGAPDGTAPDGTAPGGTTPDTDGGDGTT